MSDKLKYGCRSKRTLRPAFGYEYLGCVYMTSTLKINSNEMIRQINSILPRRKKILLSVPRYFPVWHSRSGEKTEFEEKITKGIPPKIHILKRDTAYWEEAARKFSSTRRYVANLVYSDSDGYCSIMRCRYLHVQRARFGNDPGFILVDGKPGTLRRDRPERRLGMRRPDGMVGKNR